MIIYILFLQKVQPKLYYLNSNNKQLLEKQEQEKS